MRLFKTTSTLFILCTWVLTSCSIQKRHYLNGYNVSWKNKTEKLNSTDIKNETEKTQEAEFKLKAEEIETTENTASVSIENTPIALPKKEPLINTTFKIQNKIASDTTITKKPKFKKWYKGLEPQKKSLFFTALTYILKTIGWILIILEIFFFAFAFWWLSYIPMLFGFTFGVIGLIRGIKNLKKTKGNSETTNLMNRKKARNAIIASIAGLLFSLIALIWTAFWIYVAITW